MKAIVWRSLRMLAYLQKQLGTLVVLRELWYISTAWRVY
jgi:hypothetical protein